MNEGPNANLLLYEDGAWLAVAFFMKHRLHLRSLLLLAVALCAACGPGEDVPGEGIPPNCGVANLTHDWLGGSRLMFEGADTCVAIERLDLSEDGFLYKARPWRLEKMVIKSPFGDVEEVDSDLLDYESSHHNWNDVASVVVGDEVWKVNLRYPGDSMYDTPYELSGVDDSDDLLWGPIALTPIGI